VAGRRWSPGGSHVGPLRVRARQGA
jgi:hypothetical protein